MLLSLRAMSVPHTHHCGGGVTRVLTQGTANHLQLYPVLGRNSAPHDAVRDALSHLVVQNGVTDAAVVETRLTAADGSTFDADVVFFDPFSRARVSWKYQSSQSGPTLHWDAARELGWMGSTRSCERVRRTSAIIASSRGCLTRREITLFSPPSLCQPVELWAPQWLLS